MSEPTKPNADPQPFRLHWLAVLALMLGAFAWGYDLRGQHDREAQARRESRGQ